MAEYFTIEVTGKGLNDVDRARLTQSLKQRIKMSCVLPGNIMIEDATRPAAPEDKALGTLIIGALLVKVSEAVGDGIKDAIKDEIKDWARPHMRQMVVKITDALGYTEIVTAGDTIAAASAEEHKYAILIANQKYSEHSGIDNLNKCYSDVQIIRDTLLLYAGDFISENIHVLYDEKHGEIEKRIEIILSAARNNIVIIYYSGHGCIDPQGELCLAASDSQQNVWASYVEYNKIINIIRNTYANKVGIILDCCYAGKAVEGIKGSVDGCIGSKAERLRQDGRSFAVIAATSSTEAARDGVLSNIIADGVRSGKVDAGRRGYVTFRDLYEYILHRAPINAPQISGYKQIGSDLVLFNKFYTTQTFFEEWQEVREHIVKKSDLIGKMIYKRVIAYLDFVANFNQAKGDQRYDIIYDFSQSGNNAADITRAFETLVKLPLPLNPPFPPPPPLPLREQTINTSLLQINLAHHLYIGYLTNVLFYLLFFILINKDILKGVSLIFLIITLVVLCPIAACLIAKRYNSFFGKFCAWIAMPFFMSIYTYFVILLSYGGSYELNGKLRSDILDTSIILFFSGIAISFIGYLFDIILIAYVKNKFE